VSAISPKSDTIEIHEWGDFNTLTEPSHWSERHHHDEPQKFAN